MQAEDGVGLPEQVLDHSNFESVAKYYFTYIAFDFVWTLNYFSLIVLNFFEVTTVFFFFLYVFLGVLVRGASIYKYLYLQIRMLIRSPIIKAKLILLYKLSFTEALMVYAVYCIFLQ